MTSTVFTSMDQLPCTPRIVSIGAFDGVHLGHRRLIDAAVTRGDETGMRTTLVTFEPLPASVVRPDQYRGRIATRAQKLALLQATGASDIVVIHFDPAFAVTTAQTFFSELATTGQMKELWVGEAFAMGKNRQGNVTRLQEFGRNYGVDVVPVPRLEIAGEIVSSTGIRNAVENGDAEAAFRWIGRPFRITGEVVHGAHLGRTLGYPTANVAPPPNLVALGDGIYAAITTLPGDHRQYPSMTYVGTRPTVDGGNRQVETHLFDFDGDLYEQRISVDILSRLRPDEVFSGLDELVAQLQRDEVAARETIASARFQSLVLIDP